MSYSPLAIKRSYVLGNLYNRCEISESTPVYIDTVTDEPAGFVDNSRLEKMMSNGLSGFVGKPFAPVEILAVVTSVLSGGDQSKADATDIAAVG